MIVPTSVTAVLRRDQASRRTVLQVPFPGNGAAFTNWASRELNGHLHALGDSEYKWRNGGYLSAKAFLLGLDGQRAWREDGQSVDRFGIFDQYRVATVAPGDDAGLMTHERPWRTPSNSVRKGEPIGMAPESEWYCSRVHRRMPPGQRPRSWAPWDRELGQDPLEGYRSAAAYCATPSLAAAPFADT